MTDCTWHVRFHDSAL